MNIKEAKKIPIQDFLGSAGYKPTSQSRSNIWYNSPLRQKDKTPSFKVNTEINTWYDFGLESGGSIIDLVCQMYKTNVSEALRTLSSRTFTPTHRQTTMNLKKSPEPKEKLLKLHSVTKINEPALLWYLKERGISLDLAKKYLVQIYFNYGDNQGLQYALAFKNDSGDYEFRNKHLKGFLGDHKTITTINLKHGKKVAVFEGFFDFLSFLEDHNISDFQSSAIILNSTKFKKVAKETLLNFDFEKAYFFLDRDQTGIDTKDFLVEALPYDSSDKSAIYSGYDDYNDFWKEKSQGGAKKEK